MRTNSVRFTVVAAILIVVVLSMLSTGLGWYFNELQIKEDQLVERNLISLQPIITLATRNVEGGNLMKLKNRDAQDLYNTNPTLLLAKMEGTSAGSPATDFSDVIPPAFIEYLYVKNGIDASFLSAFDQEVDSVLKEKGFYLDRDDSLLYVRKNLEATNGGIILAVFLVQGLDEVWLGVLQNISLVFLIVLAGALVVGILVANWIAAPITRVAKNVTAISKTLDLTTKVEVNAKNEIGELALWFNTFIERLEKILASVTELTKHSTFSSTEISTAVEEQSIIATQQSASVSEIAGTVEELSATSSQIADNSNAVVATASNALHESKRGLTSMQALAAKMEEIRGDSEASIKDIIELGKRSKEIGKVMEIINSIADQTKLIAFNAAIEASGAGEAGKRFGVVAVEIRRLADNVMESTEEIHTKVDEIQEAINRLVIASEKSARRIYEGTALASDTQSELNNLVRGSQTTNEAASQISLSTQQQKTATQQVLSALKEIEKGILHSSTSMKQTSTMTIALKDSSLELKKLVSEFKTNKNHSGNDSIKETESESTK